MVPGLSCWHLSTAGNIAREVDTIIILCEPSFGSSSLKILLERRFYGSKLELLALLSTAENIAREVDIIIILCVPSFGSSSLKILLER
jgi:hypothetical protein